MTEGSCLCGAVSFATDAAPQGASFCHCSQCRAQSGGVWSSAHVPESKLVISGPVKWFAASETAKRGFCPECGSFLFWKAHDEDMISFSLGSIPKVFHVVWRKLSTSCRSSKKLPHTPSPIRPSDPQSAALPWDLGITISPFSLSLSLFLSLSLLCSRKVPSSWDDGATVIDKIGA